MCAENTLIFQCESPIRRTLQLFLQGRDTSNSEAHIALAVCDKGVRTSASRHSKRPVELCYVPVQRFLNPGRVTHMGSLIR